jgi:hypothetical protein
MLGEIMDNRTIDAICAAFVGACIGAMISLALLMMGV